MSKEHDESRRAFLVGAALGAGAAGVGLAPAAMAQTHTAQTHVAQATGSVGITNNQAHGPGHGAFLNDDDSVTIAAFAERLMPGAPGKPGATDTGVLNYIDLALAGAYSDMQDFYRRGLAALDAYCRKTYNAAFAKLDPAKQDEVIGALEQNKASGFTWPSAPAFFNTVRTHTMEGMFADPVYGGNRDFAGWRLVDFPGAQPLFSPDDLQSKEAFRRAPIIGLQAQAPMRRG
ncbi:MAG: gluconate 2-dehydrogenase subunit 3 family protein [Hyphomicrobiales bacterium]|nr:gluconate 2-dehydrogenase subunit 3 family protein [Hyphomicrobiales bacterium]